MINKSAALLDQFRYRSNDSEIIICSCYKGAFSIHPSLNRVVEDVFVVFHQNRWYLVDGDLYRQRIRIEGMVRANIFEGVDIEGNRFLLVSTFPLSGANTDWSASVSVVVKAARKAWVEMSRIERKDGYKVILATEIEDDPSWSKQSIDKFVMEAFGENIITADNIPTGLSGNKKSSRSGRTSHRDIDEDFDD